MRRRDWFLLGFAAGAALLGYLWEEDLRQLRERGQVFDWVPRCRECNHPKSMHDLRGGCHAETHLKETKEDMVVSDRVVSCGCRGFRDAP